MLDHRQVLDDPERVLEGLQRRGVEAESVTTLQTLVTQRSRAIQRVEELRHALKESSNEVQTHAKAGDQAAVEAARQRLKGLKSNIKEGEEEQRRVEAELNELLLRIPNLPQQDVPHGDDESANRLVRQAGEPAQMSFTPRPHWELAEALGLISFEQATKMSGARFAVFRGLGARLERALANFMLDVARENGYVEVLPPLLVKPEAMVGAGQYPKFQGEAFETTDGEYALIPTSEVPLVNLHREEILSEASLPLRYTALTPCFRREAGAGGRDTRGLIRQHQFNKVELVAYTTPERSNDELERLTRNAEDVLARLELPYRVMLLSTGDMGFAASKTYDLEVWLAGQGGYREISSCSNCWDFQARRAQIRYRPTAAGGKKKPRPELAHTLNGSGVAVGRALVAILENGQQADGSIVLPKALTPYFGAQTIAADGSAH